MVYIMTLLKLSSCSHNYQLLLCLLVLFFFWQAITQMEENLDVSIVSTIEESVTALLSSKFDSGISVKFKVSIIVKQKRGRDVADNVDPCS